MTREILITAPDAESAAEIIHRLLPDSTIREVTDTGPATNGDVVYFHEYAKEKTKHIPYGMRANRGKAA